MFLDRYVKQLEIGGKRSEWLEKLFAALKTIQTTSTSRDDAKWAAKPLTHLLFWSIATLIRNRWLIKLNIKNNDGIINPKHFV